MDYVWTMILGKCERAQGDMIRKAGVNHAPKMIRAFVMGAEIYALTIVSTATTTAHIFATDAPNMDTLVVQAAIVG
jgi:hypothetical protein